MEEKGIIRRVTDWFTHPFTAGGTQMSPLNWILIVGFLIVVVWFWQHVLLMIEGEV
jgi:hypothetical protein